VIQQSTIPNLQSLNRFDNQKPACYHWATAWKKTSDCHEQAQDLLFDITSVYNREGSDLDPLLRNALWNSQSSVPIRRACGPRFAL